MREFINSWKFPTILFILYLFTFKRELPFENLYAKLITAISIPVVIACIARFETPSMTRARKEKEQQPELEAFAKMTSEQQQLHLHAQQKVLEFNYSLVMFVITCIVSGAIIYYVNRVM
ncbi:hypothetical protein [Gimesia aquarii]|uniref:Uncharacterized protein n=1 Tax=Gimesia aquarii TaxID=2527964 RepID=A0A517WNL8_9PLAN|nr:hypothetical protein [Gimesia aquarii]QDU06835.1 hypothetical protein V202x_01780 [Gimesia aquarii]